jgi:hypothetical protein
LWDYFDAVPPSTPIFDRAVQTWSRFSAQHDVIVNHLGFGEEAVFAAHLGADVYAKWCEYLGRKTVGARLKELPSVFLNWAMLHSPAAATGGASLLARALLAGKNRPPCAGEHGSVGPAEFGGGFGELRSKLLSSGEAGVSAQLEISEGDGLFGGSHVRVDVKFSGFTVWESKPGPWYNGAAMRTALDNPASPRWGREVGFRWEDFFGPHGRMTRAITALVVVDGINATVESDAVTWPDERAEIERKVSGGVWPFYVTDSASAGESPTNRVEFGRSGGLVFSLVTRPGNPAVIGNVVIQGLTP